MESGNGAASGKGVLIPVSDSSDVFRKTVLAPLQNAYLYEESKQFFRYRSAVLVQNPALEQKYNAFRAKRKRAGYSEEELKESYGFLLFDDISKAHSLGETGVLAGNSTCTTLGDSSKGVYISMYSDCLDLNRWYHGKSGYIAIIRLTKGKVKKVLENYTQNFTAPTVDFDCHVSEQLPSVSSKTSSFLAFERTQYYMYELLDDGSDQTAQSPSAACPFAIVSFSYTDTKATPVLPQEKSEVKKLVSPYVLWRGQLQIGSQSYSVGLRSTSGVCVPAKLPPVVKVDRAISMLDLRHLLPKTVFETSFTGEASLDGLYCSLCELVPSEQEENGSLTLLLEEIKEKNLAFTILLNDGGFLILLHRSHFFTYDDAGSGAAEVLQGIFVFPESRVAVGDSAIKRDSKSGQRNLIKSSEIIRFLPALSYAEAEVEKMPVDPSEQLCEVLAQHMQSYAALINPGLASSPSREVTIFPDQYDLPDDHKHLYSSPEWSNRSWQSFTSYLSNPASFQLPLLKASEVFAAGQEERSEDLDDDVYICLSSPEEAPSTPVSMELEDQLTDLKSPVNFETSVDCDVSTVEPQDDIIAVPQNVGPDSFQTGDANKDEGNCSIITELSETDEMKEKMLLDPPTSEDLPAELIVSITSAEESVTEETLSVVGNTSTTKHNDFEVSGIPTRAKLKMAQVNSLSDQTDYTRKVSDCPEVTNVTKPKKRKMLQRRSKGQKKISADYVETPSLQTGKTPVEVDSSKKSQEDENICETSVDSGISSVEPQGDTISVPPSVAPDDLKTQHPNEENEKCSIVAELGKADNMETKPLLNPPTSEDLPAELIVSITSAEQSVTEETLSVVSNMSAIKHNDFNFSSFPTTAKLQMAQVNSPSDETDKTRKVLDCPEVTNLTKTKKRKLWMGRSKGQKRVSADCVETPSLETAKTPEGVDSLKSQKDESMMEWSDHRQLRSHSNTNWRKFPRRKRKFGKVSSRKIKVRSAVGLAKKNKSDLGEPNLESSILMELEGCPLRKKTERWDIKPVVTECGRILVPHGSVDIDDQIKSLKDKLQSAKEEECPEKVLLDVTANAHGTLQMEQGSNTAPETAVDEMETTKSTDDGNLLQNVIVSHSNTDNNILEQSDSSKGSVPLPPESNAHLITNEDTDSSSQVLQGEQTDTPSTRKGVMKGEFLFSRLKSVILGGKRQTDFFVTREMATTTLQALEPCFKKDKVDSETEVLKGNADTTLSTNAGAMEVSNILSVDPHFAYALGLTPKEAPDKNQKTEDQDTLQRKDSTEGQEQSLSDKPSQVIQRPLSIFRRRSRIKTLKKLQGISEECIKQKWWLHFQTPACYTSEKLKYKDFTRDNSVRKTVEEKVNSSCSSTDALNLLADLALSATSDQVPPQPNPSLERKPETSLKKCDLTKNLNSAEQESLLHTLLRQPAARTIQPHEFPSSSHLVGDNELVDLLTKEHAYSLPPSSSLLLDLPGTPFQVSPESGSTRLLLHHQTMYGDGIKTLHPSVSQEDQREHNRTPEYLKKYMMLRQKFRYSRTFVNKETSVQVTRQWQENYNFKLDSKFTKDSKEKAIVRALHGPWDFSVKDTSEEMQLLFHMWIGLFYSRSTARFFHVDETFTYPCSEESNSLEMPSGVLLGTAKNQLRASSFPETSNPLTPEALDLSKKYNSGSDQDSGILDLSLRNSNTETITSDPQVNKMEVTVSSEQKDVNETLIPLKSPSELHGEGTSQGDRKIPKFNSSETNSEVNEVKSIHDSQKTGAPQKTVCLEHTDVSSVQQEGTIIPSQKEMESESLRPETVQIALGFGQVQNGCNKEGPDLKDANENSESAEKSLLQERGTDSPKSVADKEVESDKEAGDVTHSDKREKMGSKHEVHFEMKENPCKEESMDPSLKAMSAGDNSANNQSNTICNGICLESEKMLSREEPKSVSPDQAENVNGDVDSCTRHEGQVIKSKEKGLGKEGSCISALEVDRDLGKLPIPMICDGTDLVEGNSITACNGQVKMDEQPPLVESKKSACRNQPLCANGIPLKDESTISEKGPETQSEIIPVHNNMPAEENSENDVCLPEFKKSVLLCSTESTCSLDGSSPSLSTPQTKGNVPIINQSKVMSPFNIDLTSRDLQHQENKLTEGEGDNKRILIPFIGIDISGDDVIQPIHSQPQAKVEEIPESREEIPFIGEATYPEVHGTSQICNKKAELSSPKISLPDASETVWGSESDNRCPTPTIDEKPYEYKPSCLKSTISASTASETCRNATQSVSRGSEPTNVEPPATEKLSHSTPVNNQPSHSLPHDLEARTLRVLQSINKFFKSNDTDRSNPIKTDDTGESLDQPSYLSSNYIPSSLSPSNISVDFKNKKIDKGKPAAMSASPSPKLHTELPDRFIISPFKNKMDQVLGVKLQLKETSSPVPQHYAERTDKQESTARKDYSPLYRPVPSIENLQVIPTSQSSVKHESHSYRDISDFKTVPSSSLPLQTFESAKGFIEQVNGNQGFLRKYTIEDVKQTTKESSEKEYCDTSASFMAHKDNGIIDDGLTLAPQSSIVCTVFNVGRKRPYSVLEQVSQRCLQHDLTKASVEQECLIFSEQMKQLVKRSKKGPTRQQDTRDNLRSSYSSPVTVRFSSFEEQDNSWDLLDTSFIGQKFKVDTSDRRSLMRTKEEQITWHPVEHARVCDVTAECTRLYEAKMHDICAVRKVPSKPRGFRMDRCYRRSEPSNHFDFCDQMKIEMDKTFRSNLNDVVKKSCKTKYRFYILVTADDVFFKEAKAQLEAEGHTAVEPSEFFLEDSSSLLIILKNEDIAEHICEVPHLLELKKSPDVLFAGIDKPDDIVNLTHQELFIRGGFIMFDKAALEPLSLCNMTKISEIVQELNKKGKWKWMLHHRDSRRLKENARLSAEAKEKRQFLDWGQDAGILEVLPYHECDLMSREQPDYLTCLVRLQVQNISSRYPIFITDAATDGTYERNGILTMSMNSFLTRLPSKIFAV